MTPDEAMIQVTMLSEERDSLQKKCFELEDALDEAEKDRADLVQRIYDMEHSTAIDDRDLLLRVLGITQREFEMKRSKFELSPRAALEDILRDRVRA